MNDEKKGGSGAQPRRLLHISRAIVIEGKYDKIKLSAVTDAMIITTDGFGIFREKEKRALLSRLAAARGLIVLSDSDGAGLVIRNYLSSFIPKDRLIHVYIPRIEGKEKRKTVPSKEGTLGVEGMTAGLLYKLLAPFEDDCPRDTYEEVTKTDLFNDGFTGAPDSAARRRVLLALLRLPDNISTSAMLSALNLLGGREEYERAKKKIGL